MSSWNDIRESSVRATCQGDRSWTARLRRHRVRVGLPGYLRRDVEWWFRGESTVEARSLADVGRWLASCEVDRDLSGGRHPLEIERSRRGVCRHHAKWAFRKLVELGYDARYVSGRRVGSTVPHAWVQVVLDGEEVVFETMETTIAEQLRDPAEYAPCRSIGVDDVELHLPSSPWHAWRLVMFVVGVMLLRILGWVARFSVHARGLAIFVNAGRRAGPLRSLCWEEALLSEFHPDDPKFFSERAELAEVWERSEELRDAGVHHRYVIGCDPEDPDRYEAVITVPPPMSALDEDATRTGMTPLFGVEPLTSTHFVYGGFYDWVGS